MTIADFLFRSLVMGVAATAILDLWALLLTDGGDDVLRRLLQTPHYLEVKD